MGSAKPLLVVGHRNPDTDSICSAIAYAAYKVDLLGEEAIACRAGSINAQTRYALDRFRADDPLLIADVLPRLRDIMIGRDELLLVSPDQPLRDAYEIIVGNRFSFLPVVDGDDRCVGKITTLAIAGLLGTLGSRRPAGSGGRPGAAVSPTAAEVVDSLLAMPCSSHLEPVGPTFREGVAIRDIEHEVNRYNEGGFVVTGDDGRVAGVVTRMNFMSDARFRVVLVDHNEFSQSVDGIEHAVVEEIIDHHRIGMERTSEPITVINRVVGSTCSIVADMYRRSGTVPSPEIAGLMLSGLLSDTVVLNSPTTTGFDRSLSPWLAELAGVEPQEYGRAMFAAGSETGARSAEEILSHDCKHYEENGHRFAVSQIEMVGFEGFWARADEMRAALDHSREGAGLFFVALMVTDITTNTTLLVVSGPRSFRDRIAYPEPADAVYEMRGVLSRKKQVLPLLLELI